MQVAERPLMAVVSAYDRYGVAFRTALAKNPPRNVSLIWEEFQPSCDEPARGRSEAVRRDHMSFQCRGDS